MKTIGKISKWQQALFDKAIIDATDFICNKYNVDKSVFDLITIKFSNTCRFSYYEHETGLIRLDLGKYNYVKLYKRKTLGIYNDVVYTSSYHAYASMLLHEFTHFLQDLDNRCFSEVETTQNEIEYLSSKGYTIYLQ